MTGEYLKGLVCPICGGQIVNDGYDDDGTNISNCLNCHCEDCDWEGTESEAVDTDDEDDDTTSVVEINEEFTNDMNTLYSEINQITSEFIGWLRDAIKTKLENLPHSEDDGYWQYVNFPDTDCISVYRECGEEVVMVWSVAIDVNGCHGTKGELICEYGDGSDWVMSFNDLSYEDAYRVFNHFIKYL